MAVQPGLCRTRSEPQKTGFFVTQLNYPLINEPCREKTGFLHMLKKTKTQISFAVTAKLISAFVFATRIVQSLYFLNPKFKHLAFFFDCTARFVSDLVGNPEDGFLMRLILTYKICYMCLILQQTIEIC